MISAIRKLHLFKKTSFRVLLLLELCLLLAGIAGLFGKSAVYEFDLDAAAPVLGSYTEDAGGYSAASAGGQSGVLVSFDGISLPRGVYRITLLYDTDTNMENLCQISDASAAYKTLLANYDFLYAGLHETDFNVWLMTAQDSLSVEVTYGGSGSLVVTGLKISETNALSRMMIFCVAVGALFVNALYAFAQYDRQYHVAVKTKNILFCLGLIILAASLPLMTDRMISTGDLIYHLLRIEGIKDGLLSGQFPVRIAPEWQQGYGYASSIFYGETVLYLAAFFRLIGFPVVASYRMFWFVVTAATVLIAFYCFSRIFQETYIGLLCSLVYSLSLHRIIKTYVTGSLGETLGVMLLPVLAWGFYRVFTEDTADRRYRRSWIPLTIGFAGLVQSHLLTGEQAGFFTILLCVVLWKKAFRRRTFTVLAKTVIYSCLVSTWFLVPFADYMLTGDFAIQHTSGRTIQYRGLYPAQLLQTFFQVGDTVLYDETGLYQARPLGLGIAFILVFCIWIGLSFFHKTERMNPKMKGLGKISAAFGFLAMLMCLSIFPWDRLQNLSPVLATLISSIQFPDRFLSMATLFMTLLTGVVTVWVRENQPGKGVRVYVAVVAGLAVVSALYLTDSMLLTASSIQVYNAEAMGTGYISGGEYIPYGTDTDQLVYRDPETEENVVLVSYEKNGLTIQATCYNDSDREGAMSLPLLYYKGYQATDLETGESIPLMADDDNILCVAVPAGYQGTILVQFVSPWYWRAAEVVSALTFLMLAVCVAWSRKRERNGELCNE